MTALAPIVVGVDGGESSVAVMEFALREAHLRETHVLAVTCWVAPQRDEDTGPPSCATRQEALELLEHVIAVARRRLPGAVPVLRAVENVVPARGLVDASRGAELLVLGVSPRRGLTVEHCLLHSEAPVALVPRSHVAPRLRRQTSVASRDARGVP